MVVGQHDGLIYAGKRLVKRVIQEAGGAYGQWVADGGEVGFQIITWIFRERRRKNRDIIRSSSSVSVAKSCSLFCRRKLSKTSVPMTKDGGTVTVTSAGLLTSISGACRRYRTKASARAFPPSEPPPRRVKLLVVSNVLRLKSAISESDCSRLYSSITVTKCWRIAWAEPKSDTRPGRRR